MFSNYGPLCTEVYQATKPVGTALNGDIDYYSQRLSEMTGEILEAGVGTGRLLIPLLQDGLKVQGVDQSADMLAICKKNLQDADLTTTLYHDDLATMSLGKAFAAIIIPTSTFSLIETEERALQVLDNLLQHLAPGGRLILDLDFPFYPELGELTTTTHYLTATTGITLESKTVEIDWLKQQTITHLKYDKWSEGELVATELQQLLLRWYGLTEFRLILESIGFTKVSVSADYDYLTPPSDSNQTITFEAHKSS